MKGAWIKEREMWHGNKWEDGRRDGKECGKETKEKEVVKNRGVEKNDMRANKQS